jgi:hypothetical protein
MKYCDHNERGFIGRVSKKVIPEDPKSQWPNCEIRAFVALIRKRYKLADCAQYFFADAVGSHWTFPRDEFPYFGDVMRRARVEVKTLPSIHFGERCLSSSSSRCRKLSKKASPSIGFTLPLLMSS